MSRNLIQTAPPHFARLLRLLMRKGRSREDAEDLIQEAMLRLHLYAKRDVVINEEAFLIHAVLNSQSITIVAIAQQRPGKCRSTTSIDSIR
jgi:DNA-directed RNA polymerase specialized sigma24 family protein